MKKDQNHKSNSQRGAIGFLVVLLSVAVAAVAITVLVGVNRRSEQVASNVDKDVLSQIASQEASNIIGNLPSGMTYQGILTGFNQNRDQGVTFYLPAGETVELNPTVNDYCVERSCVIKIWWHNDSGNVTCADQASLLVSEYSQDGRVCEDGYTTECTGDTSRNGELNERARYYLFRPYACASDTSLEWAGYETAFGSTSSLFGDIGKDATATSGRSLVGVKNETNCLDNNGDNCDCERYPGNCYAGFVSDDLVHKTRQEFRYDEELSKSFANYYEIPVWPNTTIVRIKALYTDTSILVDLPGQIIDGTSTTTYPDGTSATVHVVKTLEEIPSVFDFALFAGEGSISKAVTD